MKSFFKKLFLYLGIFLGLFAIFLMYGLQPLAIPTQSQYRFDLAAIRQLALSQKGPLPQQIRSLSVVENSAPGFIAGTGWNFQSIPLYGYSYQLVYPKGTVIIDAIQDQQMTKKYMPWATFLPTAYQQMQQAMRRAKTILVTHEHFDHSTGIARSPYLQEIASRVLLTEEQLNGPEITRSGFTPAMKKLFKPLHYRDTHALLPGVVLIKAPGHTPGSQMIYVRLQNQTEYLLVGDVAWQWENVTLPRTHPRLINWVIGEDGPAMTHQLRFLYNLHQQHPKLHMVISHDHRQMQRYLQQGLIHKGFRL